MDFDCTSKKRRKLVENLFVWWFWIPHWNHRTLIIAVQRGRANAVWVLGFLARQTKTHLSVSPKRILLSTNLFQKENCSGKHGKCLGGAVLVAKSILELLLSPNILYSDLKKRFLIILKLKNRKFSKIFGQKTNSGRFYMTGELQAENWDFYPIFEKNYHFPKKIVFWWKSLKPTYIFKVRLKQHFFWFRFEIRIFVIKKRLY